MFLCDNQRKFRTFSKQIFWKTKTFFKKLENRFLVETTEIENIISTSKLLCQKPMLRQLECQLQNGPITEWSFASNYVIFLEIFFQF